MSPKPPPTSSQEFQKFLDNVQYNKNGLSRYEWIFGETFLSTGGIDTTKKVFEHVQLPPRPKVLDIGSGTGGHDFLMAEWFKADVLGIDLSQNMMDVARRHLDLRPHLKKGQSLNSNSGSVTFEIMDCTTCDFPEASFDLVYSRDTLLHVENKFELFKNIYKWLKPGGTVLVTDYVRGPDVSKYSQEFKEYLSKRGYFMATLNEYENILNSSGFRTKVKNWSHEFKTALEQELSKLRAAKVEFLNKFSEKDFNDLEQGWLDKIRRAGQGEQGWVLAIGHKPRV